MVKLWDIKRKVRQEMEVNTDSTTYNNDRLRDMINEVSLEIVEWKVSNELTGKFIQGNVLESTMWKFAIQPIADLFLIEKLNKWDNRVWINTKDLDNEWAVLINDEVITYTSKDLNSIKDCKWVLSNHIKGSSVIPLYSVPDDFWKPIKMYRNKDNNKTEIFYKSTVNNIAKYYEIKNSYVYTYGLDYNTTYYIDYIKKYVPVEDNEDKLILPEHISLNILPYIVWGRLIKDEILRMKLLTQGYNKLVAEYTKQGEHIGRPKGISWKRFWFSSI